MGLLFVWDRQKALGNARKHGVTFEEASTIFADGNALTSYDDAHSESAEDRFVTMGLSARGRLLVVVHCDRQSRMRLISARTASPRETEAYVKARSLIP